MTVRYDNREYDIFTEIDFVPCVYIYIYIERERERKKKPNYWVDYNIKKSGLSSSLGS